MTFFLIQSTNCQPGVFSDGSYAIIFHQMKSDACHTQQELYIAKIRNDSAIHLCLKIRVHTNLDHNSLSFVNGKARGTTSRA